MRGIAGGLVVVLALGIGIPIVLKGGTGLPGGSGKSPFAAPPTPSNSPRSNEPTEPPPTTCTCRVSTPPPKTPLTPPVAKSPSHVPPIASTARVAFASDRTGNFDIYTMNASGTGVTRLTTDAADERDPSWSPDGKQIAFTRKNGPSDFTSDIFVMNADGSNQRKIVRGGAPKFSPDGKQLAYHALLGENVNIPLALWVVNLDGTGKRVVTDSGSDPTWTPDGRSLVFGGITGPIVNVWKIAVTPGAKREHLYSDPIFACMPDVSPDGKHVAYVTAKISDVDISQIATKLVVATIGGPPGVRITESPNWEFAPSWSADGTMIAVERDTDLDPHYGTYAGGGVPAAGPGRSWIVVLRTDGSGELEIPNHDYSDVDPAFSPRAP